MSMPVLTLSSGSNTLMKDASFASYFEKVKETFVLQSFDSSTPALHNQILFRKSKTEDRELDVFNAEKYFKEALNCSPRAAAATKDLPSDQLIRRNDPLKVVEHPQITTPSVRSERSWNSRSALLHNIPSRNQQNKKTKMKHLLASIGCNCSCGDNNSVHEENPSRTSARNGKLHVGDKTKDHLVSKSHFVKFDEPKVGLNQKSIQVFGSPVKENENNFMSLKNKLTILSWDAIEPAVVADELKIPSVSSELVHDDDSFGDSSSDLFEIESLAKGGAGDSFVSTYAPSEASIDWSVVTASAADISQEFKPKNGPDYDLKQMTKRRPSFLSGCKSHKAVRVAGDAHRVKDKEFTNVRGTRIRSESYTSMTRFQDEIKTGGL